MLSPTNGPGARRGPPGIYPSPILRGAVRACDYLARVALEVYHPELIDRMWTHPPRPILGQEGALWVRRITWPDRLPGLKTWTGKQTLCHIIEARQEAYQADDKRGILDLDAPIKSPSGLDPCAAPTALEAGVSLHDAGMQVVTRYGVELLAILGLESLPLVSLAPRTCGFVHRGRLLAFEVESRTAYHYRWGYVYEPELRTPVFTALPEDDE